MAQALNNQIKDVVMPSPNAASLGKYGDIPVSYHTGVPNVGIPIYTLQEGPISLPISLSYHAGGVKVGEPCSWVGLNWSLQAGGMISRTVQGLPDESVNGFLSSTGGLYLSINGLNGTVTPQDIATGAKDGEPDIFSFSVGGYSGKFYFGVQPSGALAGTAVVIPQQDTKVEYFLSSGFGANRLYKFKVTTPDGAIYEFGDVGDATPALELTRAAGFNWTANGWYLKTITSADLVSTINISYTGEEYRQYSRNSPGSTSSSSSGGSLGVNYTDYQGWRLNTITTRSSTSVSPEKITFIAGSNRTDILNNVAGKETKALDRIKVENGTGCKDFVLSQSYWLDNSANAFIPTNGAGVEANSRLRLNSIQEQSCYAPITAVPATIFTYYNQTGNVNFLPHRYSSAVDHWGHYNGANTNPKGGFNIPYTHLNYFKTQTNSTVDEVMGSSNRETDEASMKLGTLQTITYPTGGNTTFDYEANTYWDTTTVRTLQDITSLTNFYPNVNCTAVLPPVPTITTIPNITPPSFTAYEIANTLFYKIESLGGPQPGSTGTPCAGITPLLEIYAFPVGGPSNACLVASINTTSDQTLKVDQGQMKILFPCLQAGVSYTFVTRAMASGVKFTIQREIVTPSAINRKVGGLRVKQITSNDAVATANNIVKTYTYNTDGTSQSSAVLYSKPTYSAIYDGTLTAYGNNNVPIATNVRFHIFTDYSIVPLSSFEGATVGYSIVKETLSNGVSTKYTYFQELIQPYTGTPVPPTQPRIVAGNLSTKLQLNSSSIAVASESNTVYTSDVYANNGGDKYFKVINQGIFQSAPTAFAIQYGIRNKPFRLSQMVSVVDNVSTTTTYTYDAGTLPKRTEAITNSNGAVTTTTYFYASDAISLPNSANNPDLVSRNMIGFPIKIRQVTGTATKWSKVDYKVFNTNQIEPEYLRECFEATPVNWIDRLQVMAYTTKGMPDSLKKNNFIVAEKYTWDNKLLTQKTYGWGNKLMTWGINYKIVSGIKSGLVERITDENGLIKKYTYDSLMRLSIVQDRMDGSGNNVQATTNYSYLYRDGVSNLYNYIGTSTTFVNATNTTPSVQNSIWTVWGVL